MQQIILQPTKQKSQGPESNRDTLICSQLRNLSATLAVTRGDGIIAIVW